MTGRAYIGEVLITNLFYEEMSELLDKQVNICVRTKREFEKTSGVHISSRKPTKKCAMKMKERKKTTAA